MNHTKQLLLTNFLESVNFEVDPPGLPCVSLGSKGIGGYHKCIVFTLKTFQTLISTICDKPVGIEVSFWTDGGGGGRNKGVTNMEVEIVI